MTPDSEKSEDYLDTEISSVPSMTDPEAFYRSAVDQTLQSQNGHLDLFLRFLLGLSLPANRRLLQGLLQVLLTHTESDCTNQETIKYIKQKLNEKSLSAERSLNLLHCLNELNNNSLVQEVQKNMRRYLSDRTMSPAQWSALSFALLSSNSDLEEFDLRKYQASETAFLGLLLVVRASTKALLVGCGLSPHSCGPLASVLSSSSLTHLDRSHNDLQDSGVELLCSGLKSAPCKLETLRLSGCLVSERGGAALASVLSSTPSHLRELDLSYNHPGPSTELLTALQDQCPLLSVRLEPAGERWMVPGLKKWIRRSGLGRECEFGLNDHSWSLEVYEDGEYFVTHNSDTTRLFLSFNSERGGVSSVKGALFSGRVGVFLDPEAGALSFYEVSSDGELFHLWTFSSSFAEPLFPGFRMREGSSATLVKDMKQNRRETLPMRKQQ